MKVFLYNKKRNFGKNAIVVSIIVKDKKISNFVNSKDFFTIKITFIFF
jgi:hypothetical protein